jgi:vacuolar-type H+-ATPase subunit F/Vma7
MARVAVIGELTRVQGFGLAGAQVLVADDAVAARSAWTSLDDDVAVVVLTPSAKEALGDEPRKRPWPLVAVMPP